MIYNFWLTKYPDGIKSIENPRVQIPNNFCQYLLMYCHYFRHDFLKKSSRLTRITKIGQTSNIWHKDKGIMVPRVCQGWIIRLVLSFKVYVHKQYWPWYSLVVVWVCALERFVRFESLRSANLCQGDGAPVYW